MTENTPSSAAVLRRLIMGFRLSQALFVVAELRIADLLKDGARSSDDLADASGAHGPSLYRILRLLASEGVFTETGDGHFALTALAEPLLGDLRARALFEAEACVWQAWGGLLHSVRTGEANFDHVHGKPFFRYLGEHPATAAKFDDLMAAQTTGWADAVIEAYDFSDIGTLVDVGGGYGALLGAILAAHPAMEGVLCDLPHVVEGAGPRLEAAGVAARCRTVGGDFFDSVPAGGDAYIMKHVLHDWDDDRCVTILANCRRVMPPDGRLLVVEVLIEPGNEPDYAKYLDVNMLVLLSGCERMEAAYRRLFEKAGFALARTVPTMAEISLIEGVPA